MRIYHEDTVHQLKFFNSDSLSVNCFLVEESDGLTLIDTAISVFAEEILRAAVTIGKPITRIVLTHVHHDHVGSLDTLMLALPNVPVHLSHREARLLAGDRTLDPDEPITPIRGTIPKNVKTLPDVLLRQGDRIGSLISVEVPGHTPGSMAFVDTRNNAMIAGDAFQTEGGIAVAGQLCPSFPYPSMGTWNKLAALDSARKLRNYNPSLLAVGHGSMLRLPVPAMEQAIDEATLNLEREMK